MRRSYAAGLIAILVLCASQAGVGQVESAASTRLTSASSGSAQIFVQPQAHVSPVLNLIRQARKSIRLEVYLLTVRSVAAELGKARQRGVDVRVMLEEHPFGAGRDAQLGYSLLQQAGVQVRWANESAFTYTHEKAMVVDDKVAGIFTFNLTSSGVYSNREFGVVDSDPTDARALQAIFDADWNRRRTGLSDPRLVVSPYNARSAFQSLIDRARHTLDLYAEEVNDSSIEAHLASARRRGVRVRLITSQVSSGVDTLKRSGVAVEVMPHPYVHAKAIVADGSWVFVGSENISSTSLDQNREAGIVLDDPHIAGVVEQTFAGDWRGSGGSSVPAPPPAPPTGGAFGVTVTASPRSVTKGDEITVAASTKPGASCRVRVTYPDGYVSRARSLSGSRTAGSSGSVSWSWRVGSTATGTAQASVTCTLSGRSTTGNTTFQIR